ncbi:MAG: DUF1330 domain-containing protein [Cephaloticoccus sp.]
MSAYLIAQGQIHDRRTDAEFMAILPRFGGKRLAVDESPAVIEGAWNWSRSVLLEFPSVTSAQRGPACPEYQPLAQPRVAAATANLVLIEGLA